MVLGSSIIKHVRGGRMRKICGKYSKICCYPGAGANKVIDHAEVELKYALPATAVIHCGGNDLANNISVNTTVDDIDYLGRELLNRGVKRVAISGMVPRIDLRQEIPELNKELKKMCQAKGYDYISNTNIYYNWHLSEVRCTSIPMV